MFRRLLYLNGLAIIGVILYHAVGWGFVAMFAWAHRYSPVAAPTVDQVNPASYYLLRMIEQFVIYTIPTFLFVSGFFIAVATGRNQTSVPWKIVWARIVSLAIPYLLWSNLVLLFFWQDRDVSVARYFYIILTGAANPAYYFIPLLIQFYLLSPLLVPLARSRWKPLLLVTGVIQLAVIGLQYQVVLGAPIAIFNIPADIIPKWFFPARIFWFSAGIVVGFHLQSFKQLLARMKWGLVVGLAALLPLGLLEWELLYRSSGQAWVDPRETLIDGLYAAAFILSILAFDQVQWPFLKQVSDLGSKSFGIYIVHSPVMEVVARGIYHIAPWFLVYTPLLILLLIVAGLTVPLIFMSLVNISPARRFYAYLFS